MSLLFTEPVPVESLNLNKCDFNATSGVIKLRWYSVASGVSAGYEVRVFHGTSTLLVTASPPSALLYVAGMKNGTSYSVHIQTKSQKFNEGQHELSAVYSYSFKTDFQGNTDILKIIFVKAHCTQAPVGRHMLKIS